MALSPGGLVLTAEVEDADVGVDGAGDTVAVADVAVEGGAGATAVTEGTASAAAVPGTLPIVSGVIGASASVASAIWYRR
jgi:hypothetical protein